MATFVTAVVALVLGTWSSQIAQPKTDFSGRWTIVGVSSGAPPGIPSAAGLGYAFEARQDQRSLTLVTGNDPARFETAVQLDGAETRTVRTVTGTGQIEDVSKAEWEGARLVVSTTMRAIGPDGAPLKVAVPAASLMATRQVWSLNADGDLVIETTNYRRTSTATYRRSP